MILTPTPMISRLLLLFKQLHQQTYQFFLEQKPQNFISKNHKFTSNFSYRFHHSLNHLYTIGLVRNYDPFKQNYTLAPYHDPTHPLFVPQEALNLNYDYLLPTHVPTSVANFFPKLNNVVGTPLDGQSRSFYTSLVHKQYYIE